MIVRGTIIEVEACRLIRNPYIHMYPYYDTTIPI